jgi:queuosine precursor transporter
MPRSLFIYSLIIGGLVCMAEVLGTKIVAIGPLTVEAGIFAFLQLAVTFGRKLDAAPANA